MYKHTHTQLGITQPLKGFPGGSVPQYRRHSFDPWVRKIQWGSNLLLYSYLGNTMDRGACWATVHGVAKKSDTT